MKSVQRRHPRLGVVRKLSLAAHWNFFFPVSRTVPDTVPQISTHCHQAWPPLSRWGSIRMYPQRFFLVTFVSCRENDCVDHNIVILVKLPHFPTIFSCRTVSATRLPYVGLCRCFFPTKQGPAYALAFFRNFETSPAIRQLEWLVHQKNLSGRYPFLHPNS